MHYLRFSSREFSQGDRRTALAETYAPLCGMDVDVYSDDLDVDVRVRSLSRIVVSDSYLVDHKAHRTHAHIADGDDAMLLVMPRQGVMGIASAGGDEWMCAPGQLHLLPLEDPFKSQSDGAFTVTSVSLPRKFLEARLSSPDKVIGKSFQPADNNAYSLLLGYLENLNRMGEILSGPVANLAELQIMDLASLVLGVDRETSVVAGNRGVRHARYQAMRNYIKLRMFDAELNADLVAQHFNISPQYLRKIFSEFNLTFTDYLNAIRLDWVYKNLANPANSRNYISTLAYRAGFSNLAWFNRAFKRRFGISPSDVREKVTEPAPE
ncbi:helix-turn-helix transcriptional regulator [Microbulbifer elongatus]|uniref:Helix-turn-helix transcriptional regulator n=1 Tax=Microbulbifer elongatus TaxID=86173 RepID=A0ABT1P204_9GAMM|nr:AraC family transcriptional regulator [Microbulbifer elongatus]MCQ3829019.1 helix-turn-helix transcriptional regulator [Microbulbifer elongatus]